MTEKQFIIEKEEWERFELIFPKGLDNPPIIRDYGAFDESDYHMDVPSDVGVICRLLNDFWSEIEKHRRGL